MRLASVLTPLSDHHLALAAQCGVEEITVRYPGAELEPLLQTKAQIERHGMKLGIIEGYLPIEKLKLGKDDGSDMSAMKRLLEHMSEAEIPLLCYNFMAGTDWVRTKLDARERGGALVTAFDLKEAQQAMSLNSAAIQAGGETITADALWTNLERMLAELLPVAEKHGVTMVMHPDDPPLAEFAGKARIMNSVENFERLMRLSPSRHNAICFCQGTFAEMGADIPAAIRRLGKHIRYVHFRDVRGNAACFAETFHDNGPTDMVAAMRAYHDISFTGPMRPDHVPQLDGEEEGEPGYTMMGRLFAYGYMRGLIQSVQAGQPTS
ncbi:mannonate dehydratase [Prosthecobacter fluviatilis]|uniref:mannonate dehydratase n=1 Tax=Prosthecobacter fluviatilis TaxID=445931 RepID=A0ABW0KJA1_9BACT